MIFYDISFLTLSSIQTTLVESINHNESILR